MEEAERPPSIARRVEELERDPRYPTLLTAPAPQSSRRSTLALIVPFSMFVVALFAFFGPAAPLPAVAFAVIATGALLALALVRGLRKTQRESELVPAVVVARQALERSGEDGTLVRSRHSVEIEGKDARRRVLRTDRRLYHSLAEGEVGVARVAGELLVEFRRLR